MKDDFSYCAVSALGCDEFFEWYGHSAFTARTGDECYVCKTLDNGDGFSEINEGGGKKMPSNNVGLIVGSTIGAVVGASVLVLAAVLIRKRTKKNLAARFEESRAPPPVAMANTDSFKNDGEVSVLE